jgi:chromosomal replication initiator protein
VTSDLASIWDLLSAELRGAVGPSLFEIWLAPLRVERYADDELVLAAPAETRAWVAERFGRLLQTSAAAVLGDDVQVHIDERAAAPAPTRATPGGTPPATPRPVKIEHETPLHPRHTFEQFVIGDGNRFAHAAALAVAENPGTAYNPLFLCGPPGVGKTHLLHAIGRYVLAADPGARVVSTTAEAFANAFISALTTKTMAAFKERFRTTDLLLVDDVQFLMAKAKTEEEFFHTFNALRDVGAQVVLTSDRSPYDLAALEERLRDRFASGLVAPLGTPDRPTRLAVLRKRAALDRLDVPDEVVVVLADRVTTNLRALEAALVRTVAFASLTQRPLDARLAAEVLADLAPPEAPTIGGGRLSVEDVQHAVCAEFAISLAELLSPSRAADVTWPRQLAMYLAREHTSASLPAIGARFGGRGHTTVMHACKRAAARLEADPEAGARAARLSTALSTSRAAPPADRPD